MRAKLAVMVAGVGLLLADGPVVAHHAFNAEFDAKAPVTLRGTVTKIEWINPHSWLFLDVRGPDGKVVNWAVEGSGTNQLMRHGFSKNSLPAGTEIVVAGYRAKDGSNKVNGQTVTFPDGRKLFFGMAFGPR
jgi:hypothetical protein